MRIPSPRCELDAMRSLYMAAEAPAGDRLRRARRPVLNRMMQAQSDGAYRRSYGSVMLHCVLLGCIMARLTEATRVEPHAAEAAAVRYEALICCRSESVVYLQTGIGIR